LEECLLGCDISYGKDYSCYVYGYEKDGITYITRIEYSNMI